MSSKNVIGFFVIFLSFNFALLSQPLELSQKPVIAKNFDDYADVQIRFDSTRIFPPPALSGTTVFRDVATGTNFMGPLDDTVRIFTVMSSAPFHAMLVNDTASVPPLKVGTAGWQRHGANGRWIDSCGVGYWGAAVGDVNGDGITDMVYGQSASPFKLFRAWWNGTTWQRETIAGFAGAIKDIAIGDADNNGSADIVLCAGVSVFRVRRSGSLWLKDSLYTSTLACNGVAVGDFNLSYTGNEIIAVSQESRIVQIRWTGSAWNVWNLIASTPAISLEDVAIGDFDPDSSGNEVVILNSGNFASYGNVFIFYVHGSSWSYKALGAFFSDQGMGKAGEVTVGEVYELADNPQVVFTAGDASTTYNYPIVLWKSDSTYWIRALPRTGGSTYGIAIDNVNKHRESHTLEMAVTGNGRIYEYEQQLLYNNDMSASMVSFAPALVAEGDSVSIIVRLKNFGYNDQSEIPVFYRASSGGSTVSESCLVNLALGDSVDYTFRTKYFAAITGSVSIKCSVGLATEQYPWDDTASSVMQIKTVLAGTKTVGTAGNFTNLTSALNAWANSVIKGRVVFRLLDPTYAAETFPLNVAPPIEYRDSAWSLSIKPSIGISPQIVGTNAGAIFNLIGINNFTLDSVTVINNGTGAVVRFSNGASNNIVSRTTLKGSSNNNTTGVVAFMGTTTSSANNNNLIENCVITKNSTYSPMYGVHFNSGSLANQNNTIRRCQIYNFSNTGINLNANASNTIITECDIYTQDAQVTTSLSGISINEYSIAGTQITHNKIRDLRAAQANAVVAGIYLYYGSDVVPTVIANNFISLDATAQHEQATLYGIFEDSYINVKIDIYFNSIYIGGSNLTSDKNSYGVYKNYPCVMNLKNNIIFNNRAQQSNMGKHYTVYCANIAGTFNSNNNDLFVSSAGSSSGQLIGFWSAPCTTLAQWQTRSGRDPSSISKNPGFVSATDLHINPYLPNVDRKAVPVAGITVDYDSQPRNASYPDIGADEYDVQPPAAFSLISPANNATLVPINGALVWHQSIAAEYYDVLLDTLNPPQKKVRALQTDTVYPYFELLSFKDYYWQIKAFNDTNPSDDMTASAIWRFKTVPVPNTPSNLNITGVLAEEVNLSWTDNASDEIGFYIKQDTLISGVFPTIDSVGANITSYTALNLTPNKRYYWRVCAYNQYGFRSFTAKDTITLARTPGMAQLDSVAFQSLKIIIDPLNNSSPTQFAIRVSYGAKTDKYVHTNGVLVDTAVWATYEQFDANTGKNVSGLQPSTGYTVQVRARNQNNLMTAFGPGVLQSTLEPLSIYYTESFENDIFPPFGWQQQILLGGGTNWTRVNAGTYPNQLPYHGQFEASYNSSNAPTGAHSRLVMPPIDLRTVPQANLKFYLYHDNQSSAMDSLVIESSTDNGLSWHRLDKFLRHAPINAWNQHLVSLHADSGYISQIAFHAYSAHGNNMYLDSISVVPYLDVMVSQISRPGFNEQKRAAFAPQVTVINNSSQPYDVPVAAQIFKPAIGFSQGFDQTTFPPSGWIAYNNDGGSQTWQRNTTSPYSGTGCAQSSSEGGAKRNDDWLVMPRVNVNSNDTLKFFCRTSSIGHDSLEVWVSTTTNALSAFVTRLAAFGVRNTNYTEQKINLGSFQGQQVYLAFINKSLNQNTIYVDAVRISYTEALLVYSDQDTGSNLAAGNSASVSFNAWTPMSEGDYLFVSYTDLPGDMNSYNNYIERLFTVSPIPVSLSYPYHNQFINDITPEFDWQDIIGATQYRIQLDDDLSFATPIVNQTVGVSGYALSSGNELAPGIYFWRVRVTEPAPQDPFSPTSRFFVDTEAPSAPLLSAPADSFITSQRQPIFTWYYVPGTDLFRLLVNIAESTVVSTTAADTVSSIPSQLEEGEYLWKVQAKDSAGNWSSASAERVLFIDLTPPGIPNLLEPANNQVVPGRQQVLIWNCAEDAVEYNIVTPTQNLYTTDTTYTLTYNQGTYTWKVRSRDIAGNWSDFSATRTFHVLVGWVQMQVLPSKQAASNKYVKDGGALVATDSAVYAFRGNKSNEFYKYVIEDDTWARNIETIPFGKKITDPTKINTKKVGKGAALCFDGVSKIYATRGNGTYELWSYDINTGQWTFASFVQTTKGCKGGTSLLFHNNLLYVLAGGQKKYDKNFFAFNPVTKDWITNLASAPLIPDGKTYKDGSCITKLGNTIYALKGSGKFNFLYSYDITSNTWTYRENESIPRVHPRIGKKILVKDGGAMVTANDRIYAIKGNKKNEFWSYQGGVWSAQDTIPLGGNSKALVKTGAALTYQNGKIFLLKGNNTNQFWQYIPTEVSIVKNQISNINTNTQIEPSLKSIQEITLLSISPNPLQHLGTVNYSVPVTGTVTMKLYNSSGRLVKILLDQIMTAGNYTMTLNADKLAKGIFFLKYETGGYASELKLIIQ